MSNREQDEGSDARRRNKLYADQVSTVVATENVYANETSAIRKKLGLGSNAVVLQPAWEGLSVSRLRMKKDDIVIC